MCICHYDKYACDVWVVIIAQTLINVLQYPLAPSLNQEDDVVGPLPPQPNASLDEVRYKLRMSIMVNYIMHLGTCCLKMLHRVTVKMHLTNWETYKPLSNCHNYVTLL